MTQPTLDQLVADKKAKITAKLTVSAARDIEIAKKREEDSLAAKNRELEALLDRVQRRHTALDELYTQLSAAHSALDIDAAKEIKEKISTAGLNEKELAARHPGFFYMA